MAKKIDLTVHHFVPRSRHGEFPELDLNDERNKRDILLHVHEALNLLFDNRTPEEMIQLIITKYSPPTDYYLPKDLTMRELFLKVRQEEIALFANSPQYQCGLCGGVIVPVESGKANAMFNCRKCGKYECFECRYCRKPARIEIKRVGYVCGQCVSEVAQGLKQVNTRHYSKIKRWWDKFKDKLDI